MSFQDVVMITKIRNNNHQCHCDHDESPPQQKQQGFYYGTYNNEYNTGWSSVDGSKSTVPLSTNYPSYCCYHDPVPPVTAEFNDLVDDASYSNCCA